MSEATAAAEALGRAPGIPDLVEAAREACTRLRWHPALRRRIPEAAAEARVRGATASAELDGARLGLDIVRDIMRGASTWHEPPDPVERVAKGAVAVVAESEHAIGILSRAPSQVLARLHVAAAGAILPPEALGRPRDDGEECRELAELGPAPSASEARARLLGVTDLLAAPDRAPTLVVAALVHGEIASSRPFLAGNGMVARALERIILQAGGLDPTGVVVPEAGHLRSGPAYLGSLIAYGEGTMRGLTMWISHCATAIELGAREGADVADAVLAGRLTTG